LDLNNLNLRGDLDLNDFDSLEEINVTGNPQLGKIISAKSYIKINAQEWLKRKFPYKQKTKEISTEGD